MSRRRSRKAVPARPRRHDDEEESDASATPHKARGLMRGRGAAGQQRGGAAPHACRQRPETSGGQQRGGAASLPRTPTPKAVSETPPTASGAADAGCARPPTSRRQQRGGAAPHACRHRPETSGGQQRGGAAPLPRTPTPEAVSETPPKAEVSGSATDQPREPARRKPPP